MKRLAEAISTLALIIALMMAAALVGVRVIGLTPYTVLSGSMEPAYSVGDLIYVKKIAPQEIEMGMPITYVANEKLVIATHRVVDISIRETTSEPVMLSNGKAAMGTDGKPIMQEMKLETPVRIFLTRGDATPDAAGEVVHERNVLGTPVYRIPKVGWVITMIKTDAGKIMLGCFGLLLAVLMFLPEMLRALEKGEKKPYIIEETVQEDRLVSEKITGEDVLLCAENTGEDDVQVDPGAR